MSSEDNGVHAGIDGQWPSSGKRMQWCKGKNQWHWEINQRTKQQHCGEPHKIYLDVEEPGTHEIQFSMREDGFEFDKWYLTSERLEEFPQDQGPEVIVSQGPMPNLRPPISGASEAPKQQSETHLDPNRPVPSDKDQPSYHDEGSSTLSRHPANMAEQKPTTNEKPKVWIHTDVSDKSLAGKNQWGTINDPDDISAMAGYLLMANEFDTLSIVVASTHRAAHATSPDQARWATEFFIPAYHADFKGLNRSIGGYPDDIVFIQSCIKETAEKYDPESSYSDLSDYSTVQSLFEAAERESSQEVINVLCWGSLTEPAILVKHCFTHDRDDVLRKLRFIAHWTNSPLHHGQGKSSEQVANCWEDKQACRFLKQTARACLITYHECGAIGQHGIVRGAPHRREFFDQFRTSQLGNIFINGKFAHGVVDHSDSATYWSLFGDWGVSLKDIPPDGKITKEIESANRDKFRNSSKRIHEELLRRSRAAAIVDP